MISVVIFINGVPIFSRTAVRQEEEFKGATKRYTYHLDDGTAIQHRDDQGAVKLAKRMLDTVIEPKNGI